MCRSAHVTTRRLCAIFLTVGLLAALLSGCGEAPAKHASLPVADDGALDLVALFPVAAIQGETGRIDIGTAGARRHLVSGWSYDEGEKDLYVWGIGEASLLTFSVVEPADLTLALTCRAFVFDGAPAQRVEVAVNDQPVGVVEASGDREEHALKVPAALVVPGQNRLRFRYAYSQRPDEVLADNGDRRPLAVQWYAVALQGRGTEEGQPRAEAVEGAPSLVLPAGFEVAYYLEDAAGGTLRIDAVEALGGAEDYNLAIHLQGDPERPGSEHEARPGAPLELALPASAQGPIRLALRARRGAASPGWWTRLWQGLRGLGGEAEGPALALRAPRVQLAATEPDAELETATQTVPGVTPPARPPNVIVYLIDTLRADHLGVYGYPRPTSPNIDRFAAEGVLFRHARAQTSWTRTAVVSIFTGLNPQAHRVNGRLDILPDTVQTMAELLQGAGYGTSAIVTNGNVNPRFGVDQGFEAYRHLRESRKRPEVHQLSDRINDWVEHWLTTREGDDRPFFLYLHSTDPHAPYMPREPFRSRFAAEVPPELGELDYVRPITRGESEAPAGTRQAFIDLYDAEIAFNDAELGRLFGLLRDHDLYENTLIVLVADHGEEFFDHGGWGHGRTLYGEQLDIPLIVKLPGGVAAGSEVTAQVRQVDILPTILDMAGVAPPPGLDGQSLLPLIGSAVADEARTAYAYLTLDERSFEASMARGFKLIRDTSPGAALAEELFDLRNDRREQRPLTEDHDFERGYLEQTLRALRFALRMRSGDRPVEAERDPELDAQLRALGYL